MGISSYIKPFKGDEPTNNASTFDGQNYGVQEKPDTASSAATAVAPAPSAPQSLYPPNTGTSTGSTSRPSFLYPGAQSQQDVSEIKSDVMVNWLYMQQMERLWTGGGHDEGVVLKRSRGLYTTCPADLVGEPEGFYRAVETLNVRVAITVNTRVIKLFLDRNERPYVPLKQGLRLQVLPDISYLPRCQKHQFAAFIADIGILVVWDDDPKHILDRAQKIETALMEMIWDDPEEEEIDEKTKEGSVATGGTVADDGEVERGAVEPPRPIVLLMPALTACTIVLSIVCLGAGYRAVASEIFYDHGWQRLLFLLALPAQVWCGLFFFQALMGNLGWVFGPVGMMKRNSKFYSGVKPKRLRSDAGPLPHVTIQMPVYKEGLRAVIEPTVASIKAAISTYEMQGGSANLFVNDDGMQLISEEDARARQDFYDEHNIGWVARPKHNPKPSEGEEVFLRRGKFKKASNMNYAMWCSNRVEDKVNALSRHEGWCQEDEAAAYSRALAEVLEEDEGRTWADGNIRIGDYILLIDSDTRVPTDCFLDCVSEMDQCPRVAIIQYSSGVMNVTDSFFERGITFFTNLIYTSIKYSVAAGDVAPFVGHDAVLRWAAMQEIGYDCELDDREKFWSENTVSEDFDMALRLQSDGYVVRLGAYTGDGFKEGVSLTVYDELSRWEKYAYGCSELIFHPFQYWLTKGPFTKLFIRFIFSNMPLPSKVTIMGYVGTYYAIGSAWILTLANYFLTGWFNGHLDHFYLNSFKVYFAIITVFTGLGNVSLAILRYRTTKRNLIGSLIENLSWVPLLSIFLGGISLHVSQAILSHLFSIDMTWGATSKEAENTTFFKEIPKIYKRFKFTYIFCVLCTVLILVFAVYAPTSPVLYFWKIDLFISIFPLSTVVFGHFVLPIVLNPGLMRFTW